MIDVHSDACPCRKCVSDPNAEFLMEGTEEGIEAFVAEIPSDVLEKIARKFKDYLSKPYQGPSREAPE